MYHKLNPFTASAAVALVLVLASTVGPGCYVLAGNDDSREYQGTPRWTQHLGPFHIDSYFNSTKLNDRLRLSKGHHIRVVKLHDRVFDVIKLSATEELVPCDDLRLDNEGMEDFVECTGAEVYIPKRENQARSRPFDHGASYTKRWTVKANRQSTMRAKFKIYPLQREFIRESVEDVLKTNHMERSGFGKLAESHGQYFEALFGPARCSGNIFTVTNLSTPISSLPDFPEILSAIGHYIADMHEHGGLISMRDVSCKQDSLGIPVSLGFGFTLIRRLEFPYLTVHHTMATEPMSFIWQYKGTIEQSRDESAKNDAYNTTIKMIAESALEYLTFSVDQTFVNKNSEDGFEKMIFKSPFMEAIVNGNWSVGTLAKSLEIYLPILSAFKENLESQGIDIKVHPDIRLDFKNDPEDDDNIQLGLKLTHDIVNASTGYLSNLFKFGIEGGPPKSPKAKQEPTVEPHSVPIHIEL